METVETVETEDNVNVSHKFLEEPNTEIYIADNVVIRCNAKAKVKLFLDDMCEMLISNG